MFATPGVLPALSKVVSLVSRFDAAFGGGVGGGALLSDLKGIVERGKAWRGRAKAALDADASTAALEPLAAAHGAVGAAVPLAVFLDVQLAWLARHTVRARPYACPLGCPYACPLGCPYACPLGCAYALPLGCPYALPLGCPYAFPLGCPYAFPWGCAYAFPWGCAYAFPWGCAYAFPLECAYAFRLGCATV